MSQLPGTRVGPYVVGALVGAGGMGQVYRARDTRLDRDVALKVVAEDAAGDAERLARFTQEARAAAALNHPNILAVFDVGTATGEHGPYIVSELLEGETLAERLTRGRLPVTVAVEIASQVARALAAAHERGIVHRDLKPDNIFLTRDGTPKVLDFGLAKLREPVGAGTNEATTISGRPGTAPGVVMGTVGYMAPEQVRGDQVDHRADLFALGATLYEMLSGRRAFARGSAVETLNAILTAEPEELGALGMAVPAELGRIVGHCLEKAPEQRFQSARDLAFHLAGARDATGTTPTQTRATSGTSPWHRRVALFGAGAVVGAGLIAAALRTPGSRQTAREVTTFRIAGDRSGVPAVQGMALSPDGHALAMTWISRDGTPQLLLSSLDDGTHTVLDTTSGPQVPFFSSDGRSVGYFGASNGALMQVGVAGGPPDVMTRLRSTRYGGAWLPDGRVVFAESASPDLLVVSPGAGATEAFVRASSFEGQSLRFPTVSPDGQVLVFQVGSRPARLGAYAIASGETRLLGAGSSPKFSSDRRLAYSLGDELWFAEFLPNALDLSNPRSTGMAVVTNAGGLSMFAVADDTLAMLDAGSLERRLVVYTRSGERRVLNEDAHRFRNNAVPSPDGRYVATGLNDAAGPRVVLYDIEKGAIETAISALAVANVEWTENGRLLAYENGTNALRLFTPGVDAVLAPVVTGVATNAFVTTPAGDIFFVGAGERAGGVFRTAIADPSNVSRLWNVRSVGAVIQLRPSPDGRRLATSDSKVPGSRCSFATSASQTEGYRRRSPVGSSLGGRLTVATSTTSLTVRCGPHRCPSAPRWRLDGPFDSSRSRVSSATAASTFGFASCRTASRSWRSRAPHRPGPTFA